MYRTALRSASRPAVSSLRSTAVRAVPRRFASTAAPAGKPRSWKSFAARWGLAIAGVYYYNTSSVFADEALPQTLSAPTPYADNDLPTVDSLIEQKRKEPSAKPAKSADKKKAEPAKTESKPETLAQSTAALEGSPEALEEEASQEGAFNPETGEINWDCPCLGGMAHGPCGEEFKTAFSCFVYSTEEPKGMDCIEKFQGMQECFRKYPDIYGAELDDAEADAAAAENVIEPLAAEPPVAKPLVAEPLVAEHQQQLRDENPIQLGRENPTEKDNLPNIKPVESAPTNKWEDATAANAGTTEEKKNEEK